MNMAQMIKIPITWVVPICGVLAGGIGLYGVYMTTMFQTENALAQQASVIEHVRDDVEDIEKDQVKVTESIEELDDKVNLILIALSRIETILESE